MLYVEDTKDNQRIDYIHLGGKLIAERSRPLYSSTATVTYHHTDHIGSANVETDAYGDQTQRTTRVPYGSPYDGVYREGPGYAGHVTDTQTNLTYMQQRYYDPVALRFLSPDPVDVSASDGGNFNRYWYGNNNPYKFVDPDGRFIQAIVGAAIGIVVDVAAQQIVNGLGSEIDMVSVTASAALGAATAGVGAIYAQSAKIGAITATQAVSRTAAVNGAIGGASSAAESIANGEAPDPSNMAVAGAMTMGLSAGAGRLSNAQAIRAEAISAAMPNSPAGIGGHIASITQSAGSAAATQSLAASTAQVGADVVASTVQKKLEEK